MTHDTDVLIVGGSLNGLTTALLLARHGVRCIVVERHPDTTVQYKFAGISPRSMEIFRWAGIEQEIHASRTGDQKAGEIARARNLADPDLQFMGRPWSDMDTLSVATAETCDQDVLEPILRRHAAAGGADIRFHTELVDFTQNEDGVQATIRDLESGEASRVFAQWMIAADGVGGATRERLGIGRSGPGVLQHWMNLIFETDLEPFLQGRRFTSCFVSDINASVTPRPRRWLLSLQYRPDQGESPEDFDADRVRDLVRQAAGRQDVRVDLFDAREWAAAGFIADRFSHGRVFLLGDAAHSMPPTGGFGGNTGIHDAHNLAWKLAHVLNGRADPALLDTYDVERRHVAARTLAQALARLAAWFKDLSARLPPPEPIAPDANVIFGQHYPRGALAQGADPPPSGFSNPFEPTGAPGERAPHIWLADDRRALHDAIGDGFLLVSDSPAWIEAAGVAADRRGVTIATYSPHGDSRDAWREKYGVSPDGAVLVRPDGFIGWRAVDASGAPDQDLRGAFDRILGPASPR
ncbi:2-polyprenyl-6-methoxyphenol hydroxylase-like FAD-dependent oxidoreductase [Caulobacter ginsengisoli]|uniref:2-polyprenyl-6-methoxyphenol hydroxylase-like FAD-dependent oxidoreductase n=1 Tax=Caulobacter ginsengisoli TaxID=400775 RepID=A0ABU0IVH3_9CAUL|nr:FAD-dependent monooxygenase [Caulobacter ginsengisoli]MDQ0466015.1 2-polyprenyl-6-methoxyphenol hydroxylase-like FAD-dependent oxidoreductase [Caulobacter ginsengisoli]